MLHPSLQFLLQEPGPKMLVEALNLLGTKEIVGKKHNKTILAWAKEVGLENVYKADEIPWCGLFMAVVAQRADKEVPKDPLWALNWNKFGKQVDEPMLGDVLTFQRKGGGHVGLYVYESPMYYGVLGGNQGNSVSVTAISKSRLSQARRPLYNNQPANVRKIEFKAKLGDASQNEQ